MTAERIRGDCNTPKPCTEPPYSVGQASANDLNANVKYPTLDRRIEGTYAKRSNAGLKRNLYDSYIRAFRWATDRITQAGVVGFVSNGGWIDWNTMDGMRLSLAGDYAAIYAFNLRGNQRTAGELSRREGGKVFGGGSRNTVAIFVGVMDPNHRGACEIFYCDIGDYLSREEKLRTVAESRLDTIDWDTILPNAHGDWVNQRDSTYADFPVIGDKKADAGDTTVFRMYSLGVATNRDAWAYDYSQSGLRANVDRLIGDYNRQIQSFSHFCKEHGITRRNEKAVTSYLTDNPDAADERDIKWSSSMRQYLARGVGAVFDQQSMRAALYRPFNKQNVYFNAVLNERTGQLPSIFPTPHHENIGIEVAGASSPVGFGVLAIGIMPDVQTLGNGQLSPRWTYEKVESSDGQLDYGPTGGVDQHGYLRIGNITDAILTLYREAIGDQVTKDDIFYYVYGLLHDPDYREKYAVDLKKMLPHIPTPESRERFGRFADAGRKLAELHINYESVQPYPLDVQLKAGVKPEDRETWRVEKMKWKSKTDHSAIIYNGKVTIAGIPEDAERYMVGSRSALAWLIDRYQVKVDKASGIVNDPNDWCDEHDDPTYIVDLIKKVTTVSVETMKIVDGLSSSI